MTIPIVGDNIDLLMFLFSQGVVLFGLTFYLLRFFFASFSSSSSESFVSTDFLLVYSTATFVSSLIAKISSPISTGSLSPWA